MEAKVNRTYEGILINLYDSEHTKPELSLHIGVDYTNRKGKGYGRIYTLTDKREVIH